MDNGCRRALFKGFHQSRGRCCIFSFVEIFHHPHGKISGKEILFLHPFNLLEDFKLIVGRPKQIKNIFKAPRQSLGNTPGEIAAFGLIVTKTKAKHWKEIAAGEDKQGFEWFKVYKAEAGNHVAIAVTGVGPKGSYILVLKTLKTNYKRFQAAYDRWAASVTVY